MGKTIKPVLAAILLLISSGCTGSSKPTLWIYASVYPFVVQSMRAKVAAKFPEVDVRWYQAGSENVAIKVTTELFSGKTRADLLMTSDLFWYEDLKARHALLAYDSPATARIPAQFKDPDHTWAASRVPVMVIAYNSDVYSAANAPKGWSDLASPRFKDKIAMPSPLESGTTFTAVALVSRKLGWDLFTELRANGALSAGGNSTVMARLESKERPVGIILLENILATRKKNPKIVAVYPSEGAVTVPSPLAITAGTKHPELARKLYDYFFSPEMQEDFVKGCMYSIFDGVAPPAGALPWKNVYQASIPWNRATIDEVRAGREKIKERFSRIMLE